jgi:hypothetical protein
MLVRPSSRIGSFATTPIRIGSKLYIADIEPLSLPGLNERRERIGFRRVPCSLPTKTWKLNGIQPLSFVALHQTVVTDGIPVLITLK